MTRYLLLALVFAVVALALARRPKPQDPDFREYVEPEWDVTYSPAVVIR